MDSERSFDELAENYDRRETLTGDPLEPWLRGALPATGKTAVDLACGAGRHAIVIGERYERVLAVDLSPRMIQLARRRRPAANIVYRVSDLLDVDGQFDLVFCSAALHDLDDLDRALRHIRSLVAPGGRAILADVVAGFLPPRRWLLHTAALVYLVVDSVRRRPDALELYRLGSERAWIGHLVTDRYLSRSEFKHRYAQYFPGARFSRARHLEACAWEDS